MSKDFYAEHDTGPEWGTPEWIWRPLSEALDGFDLDPASGAEPKPIAARRFTLDPESKRVRTRTCETGSKPTGTAMCG